MDKINQTKLIPAERLSKMDDTDFCAFVYTSTNKEIQKIIEEMKKMGEEEKAELAQMALTRRAVNRLAFRSRRLPFYPTEKKQ